eukprot:4342719-Alexandrium_andersonii.AAC.1
MTRSSLGTAVNSCEVEPPRRRNCRTARFGTRASATWQSGGFSHGGCRRRASDMAIAALAEGHAQTGS